MRYLLVWFSCQRWQPKNTDLAKANTSASKVIFALTNCSDMLVQVVGCEFIQLLASSTDEAGLLCRASTIGGSRMSIPHQLLRLATPSSGVREFRQECLCPAGGVL